MTNINTTRATVETARSLGMKAFAEGRICAPVLDAELMEMLQGYQVGESAPMLKAWGDGWMTANLAEDTFARIEKSNQVQERFTRR